MLLDDCNARVCIEHPLHGSESRRSASLGCSRSLIKSAGNFSRLSIRVSQDLAFGRSTTALPTRLISTSFPVKRNSFGKRTAWLSPFLNNLAVFMRTTLLPATYIFIVYMIRGRSSNRPYFRGDIEETSLLMLDLSS